MFEGYIYKTTDLSNGLIYIGQRTSSTFDTKYYGSSKLIKKAIREKGKKNFTVEILEWCNTIFDLDDRERYWIKELDACNPSVGYNRKLGGNHAKRTINVREHNPMDNPEVRAKHAVIMKSEEVRAKISANSARLAGEKNGMYGKGYLIAGEKNGMYGKTHSAEYKERLKKTMIGEGNPQYGKRGELATCYGRTGEKHPMYGKHHDPETRKRISESLRRKNALKKNAKYTEHPA